MKITKEDIHLISRHSNWSAEHIDQTLKKELYPDTNAWQKFIKLFCISLGITFTTLGILFFFAYNWADLHKFIKIGLVEGLIIAATLVSLVPTINTTVRQITLTGASMLVGILFAVFGQIYQTGANAYDFFLGWTAFIALWVLVSNFAPLWLLFLTLINTTFILYTEQVATGWEDMDLFVALFVLNALFTVVSIALTKSSIKAAIPTWFIRVLALATIGFATTTICMDIFSYGDWIWNNTISLISILYVLGIVYGLITKDKFYLAAIPFSVVIIFSAILVELMGDSVSMFFTVCIFVIVSVSCLVKTLLYLQKTWSNE